MDNPGFNFKEISGLVGFSSQQRFNECFRNILGISPTVFKDETRRSKYDSRNIFKNS